jgi:hypothetical protein
MTAVRRDLVVDRKRNSGDSFQEIEMDGWGWEGVQPGRWTFPA